MQDFKSNLPKACKYPSPEGALMFFFVVDLNTDSRQYKQQINRVRVEQLFSTKQRHSFLMI
ncbi:hypothetical protein CsatA_007678 [Cannabis sativa]